MIFLADESLDRQIVDVLRRDDHVVLKKHFDSIQNGFAVVSPSTIRIRRVS